MEPLTEEQIAFVTRAFSEWFAVLFDEQKVYPTNADVDHSALLHRLLEGKKPFPNPPPKRFSYPCYALAEGEKVEIGSFTEHDNGTIHIDQSDEWRWYNKTTEQLTHVPTLDRYMLTKEPTEREENAPDGSMMKVVYIAWFLQKVPVAKKVANVSA